LWEYATRGSQEVQHRSAVQIGIGENKGGMPRDYLHRARKPRAPDPL
jgi:hypothetical protein